MKTFVLGTGASAHIGYPLASSMGSKLFDWIKTQQGPAFGYSDDDRSLAKFGSNTSSSIFCEALCLP